MRKILSCLFVALILLSHEAAALQKFHFGVSSGTSFIVGKDAKSWNLGFHLSGKAAYQLSPLFQVGALISYHRFSPDLAAIESIYRDSSTISYSGSFSRSYLELIPYIGFYPMKNRVGIFFQAGAGLVIIQRTIDVDFSENHWYYSTRYQYKDDSHKPCPAILLGTGIYIPINGKYSLEVKIEGRYVGTKDGFPAYSKTIFSGSGQKYISAGLGFNY